jgi:hypothetical protein
MAKNKENTMHPRAHGHMVANGIKDPLEKARFHNMAEKWPVAKERRLEIEKNNPEADPVNTVYKGNPQQKKNTEDILRKEFSKYQNKQKKNRK